MDWRNDMDCLTHLSLFSGIGGLDLAAEWAGFKTVGQCEWADYPRAVLEKHWPGLPRWRDIRTLTKESFYEQTGLRTVDVISGGFPCQPFSTAGKRRGKEDDRYLWPEMLIVIQEIRPRWVIGENVAGIVTLALDTVLSDLESIGYACQAVIIPACAVDAPHRRDRCAILAHANGTGLQRSQQHGTPYQGGQTEPHGSTGECGASVAYSNTDGCTWAGVPSAKGRDSNAQHSLVSKGGHVPNSDNQRLQIPRHEPRFQKVQPENGIEHDSWWPAEPDVGRVAHGVPARVDRLRCLGNAVVPQQFYPFFAAIAEIERKSVDG